MYSQKRIFVIGTILIALFTCSVTSNAEKFPVEAGKLGLTDLEPIPGSPVVREKEALIPGLKRPPCKIPPNCAWIIADVMKLLGTNELSQIAIVVTPVNGDVSFGTLSLQIYSKNREVFSTKPACGGCNKMLKAAGTGNAAYVFTLDADALKVGHEFFVPENRIGITADGTGKGGARLTFSVVKLTDSRPRTERSKANK